MQIYVRWALVFILIALKLSGFRFNRRKFIFDEKHQLPVHEMSRKLKGQSILTILSTSLLRPTYFKLTHESSYTQFCKRLGIGPEPITLNPEFDEAFYVASDNAHFLNTLRSKPELQRNLLELHSLGCTEILSDDEGILTLRNIRSNDDASLPDLQSQLRSRLALVKAALDTGVEALQPAHIRADPFQRSIARFDQFIFGASIYGILGYLAFPLRHVVFTVDLANLIAAAAWAAVLLVGVTLLSIMPTLKSSARAPWVFSKFLIFAILGGFEIGFILADDLNQALASSPIEVTQALVVKKYESWTSGNRRQKIYSVNLVYPEGAPTLPTVLSVSTSEYHAINVGEGLELHVKKGFLNARYITNLASVPAPEGIQANSREAGSLISDQQARSLSEWRAEPLPAFGTGQEGWEEVRYASGAFRERVPLVNHKKHGRARYWHENGRLYGEIPWVNNEKHGCFKLYRPDGTIENDLSYRDGKLHGISTWYDAAEKPTQRVLYDNGTPVNNDPKFLEDLFRDALQRASRDCDVPVRDQ